MARGWESKSVEFQQEAAEASSVNQVPLTPVQQRIHALQLSRKHILDEIAASSIPRFRELKKRALNYLDSEIAQLQQSDTQL